MYFASRMQAGRMLAEQLAEKYQNQNCSVLALNDGGAMVGAQIAVRLHCVLTMLASSEILLPREPVALAGITSDGTVGYNQRYSKGEIDEFVGEYYGYIEQEKLTGMHNMNHMMGGSDTTKRELLKGHNVILVTDGLKDGFQIDLAVEFLKPIAIEKLICAIPMASVQAVDRMHVLADELYCLSTIGETFDTDHYYDTQDVPDHETIIKTIENLVSHWQ
jgi:predicted phosphoribosyltransferase